MNYMKKLEKNMFKECIRMSKLKTINELIEGECTVITADGREYHGNYNSRLEVVFFCIPQDKEIIGYIQ